METPTQPETIQISPYDNEISLLYKVGQYFETPTRYVTVRDREAEDETMKTALVIGETTYEPFIDVLARTLDTPNISLQEAFNRLVGENSNLTRQEFAFFYFSLALVRGIAEEEAFQQIQEFLDKEGFRSLTDLRVRHEDWLKKWDQELNEDAAALERILGIQDRFENIPQEFIKPTTDLIVDRVTLRAFPTLASGERPTFEDGLDIFNSIRLSYLVPYAHFNEGSEVDSTIIRQTYYKIYRGETITSDFGSPGAEPNLSMIIPTTRTKATNKGNLIYATVWTGDTNQVITRPTREGYTKVVYDLDTGTMTFKTKISQRNPQAKEFLIQRISEAFPGLILGEITEIRISGEFDIFLGEDLRDYILLHEILNNPIFTTYLYIDERQKAYPEKKRITIHYRSILGEAAEETVRDNTKQYPASVSAVLVQKYATEDQATPEILVGTPYLRVNITKGASRDITEQFREILVLLMGIYLQDRSDIEETYNYYIPPLQLPAEEAPKTEKGKTKVDARTKRAKRRIYQLQELAPHIFLPGYARRCQGHLQPLVITQEEAPEWKAKLIKNKITGHLEERQIMPFPPPPNDEILVVCPDDSAPYPGVKENQMANADIYPFIPCCNETDQTIPGKKTNYNAYYRGAPVKARGEKRRMNIITDKILYPGGMGEIPATLEKILLRYSPNASNFKRFGVIRDPNSLIHCLLEALDYMNYTTLGEENKIALVSDVRRSLVEQVQLAVTKQELFDFSLEDIKGQILAEDLFFDPALYYRTLEEFFNVNIYTFTPGKRPKEDRGEAIGKIEIPRHKLFHARPLRLGRQTVLIFKHWGAEADALDYPQCELLVDYNKETRTIVKVFDDEMTVTVHNILLETFPVTTWSYQSSRPETPDNLIAHTNLYSQLNFDALTGYQATAQILDDYGKLRGLVIPKDGQEVTIFFIPSQPENLPVADQVPLTTGEEAEKFLGPPNGVTLDIDQKRAIGLWFPHQEFPNYPYVIFVPITPTPKYLTLDQGPPAPIELTAQDRQTVARVLLLQRQISFLLQIIRWLFLLARANDEKIDVALFMTRYTVTHQEPVEDSARFYDLSQLPHRLPNVQTPEEAIVTLSPLVPTLFREGRLVLYSTSFAEKIRGYLENFLRQTHGLQIRLPRFLDNYYVYESDFEQQPRTVILIGQDNFNAWLSSLNRAGYRGITIITQLDVALMNRVEPYLYQTMDGSIYLGQNVENGELARALQVAVTWYMTLTNPGFTAAPYPDIETLPYRIYDISPSSTLRLKNEFVDPETPPDQVLEILEYGENTYAALLPLSVVIADNVD